MEYRFYLEENRWFIDLPEWKGDKDDLEMVSGADHLLYNLSNGEKEVYVMFDDIPFVGCSILTHIGDGWYDNDIWCGPSLIWLCYVTEFVFGEYPHMIYYKLA